VPCLPLIKDFVSILMYTYVFVCVCVLCDLNGVFPHTHPTLLSQPPQLTLSQSPNSLMTIIVDNGMLAAGLAWALIADLTEPKTYFLAAIAVRNVMVY
jgi:hypothetical protein